MSSPLGIREDQRVAVFIDGPSFYATTKSLGWDVDYRKLRAHLDDQSMLYRVLYFTAITDDPEQHSPVVKLVDWLSYNGFRTFTKPLREYRDPDGRRRVKGNSMHVEIAVEMMEAVPFADHLLLFSGDGELSYAVESVQRRGAKVTAVSSVKNSPPSISDDLRRSVDNFVDLCDLKDVIFKRDFPQDAASVLPLRAGNR
ncbi:unnamed protein product [Sphagnum tenellum]